MTRTMAITVMTTTMTTTIAMTMATMAVNDYGYNGDDGNVDDDDDDDEYAIFCEANLYACTQSVLMQELTGSPTIADAGVVPLNGLA